jgi:hypothetical protein
MRLFMEGRMKRLKNLVTVALPIAMLVAAPSLGDVKTRDRTTVKFESHLLNFFLGKAAKDGLQSTMAVKGDRKATFNDSTGKIVDLSEEKVYDLDMKKKTYTVTTFDQLRKRMQEQADKAKDQAQKEEPSQPQAQEQQKPQKEYEVDFDVKDTGQKKPIAGYDTHETIVTITVRQKGMTLEQSGGMVMTNDMWLGPKIPQLKESADFEIRYWKQLEGPQLMNTEMSADQMAALMAMYPLIAKASDRLAKDSDKLSGTALEITSTIDSVKSPDQMQQQQQQQQPPPTSGSGFGSMLAKKMMKKEEPKQRSTVMTTHHEILEVSTTVAAADLAIPADFKEKK